MADRSTRTALSAHRSYSVYYFAAVSFHAFILGFFPIHCRELAFGPFQIAMLSAIGTLATIFAGPMALSLAHHRMGARGVVLLLSALALGAFLPLFAITSFVPVMLSWFAVQLLRRGADSVVDAQAVRDSAHGSIRFEHVRVWGSVGFIGFLAASGELLDAFGSQSIVITGAVLLLGALVVQPLVAPLLASAPARLSIRPGVSPADLRAIFRGPVGRLLVANALVWGSHSALYVYLSLYLEALGSSGRFISLVWNVGVCAEIFFLFLFPTIASRLSLVAIFRVSLASATLRWLLLSFTNDPYVILGTQLLHAFSFGGCYLASTKLVFALLPEDLKDRGQGYLLAAGPGIGSLGGRLLVGWLAGSLASYAQINQLFLVSSLLAALALLVAPSRVELPDSRPRP